MSASVGVVHEYEPTTFHHTFGAHEPVLTVNSGDRVRTSTVDASGRDANDVAVTEPGNPLTGPFYVKDAMPGDTLVVHLRTVRPNRRRGFSSPLLAPVAVEPENAVDRRYFFASLRVEPWRTLDRRPCVWQMTPKHLPPSLRWVRARD